MLPFTKKIKKLSNEISGYDQTFNASAANNLVHAVEKISVHDHLCLIYKNKKEQFSTAIPFMHIGLARGEKCIYIADDNTAEEVLEAMRVGNSKIDDALRTGALSIVSKQETYLRNGYFDPDEMIQFLREATDLAKSEGYSALRATGEMTWMLGKEPGTSRLLEYESKLNYFFPNYDCLALCQYNYDRFTPDLLTGVIHTHPIVVFGETVCKNFYYVPPEEFLETQKGSLEVERLLGALVERESVEKKLADVSAQKDQYLKFFMLSADPMCIADPFGNFKQVNPEFVHLTGYTEKELISKPFLDFVLPEDRQKTEEEMRLQVSTRPSLSFENRYMCKNGTVVLLSWTAFFDKENGATYATARDITNRRQGEKMLAEQTAILKKAQRIAQIGNWTLDLLKNELTWSDEVYRIFEIPAGTPLTYEKFLKLVHPDDRAQVSQAWAAALRGKPYDIEHRIIAGNEVKWVREKADVEIAKNGNPVRGLGTVQDITTHKHDEAALHESEEMFRAISTTAQDGVVLVDNAGKILYWNPAAERIFGYTAKEVLGKNAHLLLAPLRYHHAYTEAWPTFQQTGGGAAVGKTLELQGLHKDGSEIEVELSLSSLKLNHRWNAVGIIRDITDRKKIEAQLRESEEKFRVIFEGALDGILLADTETKKFTVSNPIIHQMLGYTPEEITHLGVPDIHPEKDLPNVLEQFEKLRKGDITLAADIPVKRKNGSVFYADIKASPVQLGKKTYLIGIFRDITERKESENLLRESEERFRNLVETTSDWIWEVDKYGVYTYVSPKVQSLLGYLPEEVIGKIPFDFMPKEEAVRVAHIFNALIATQKPLVNIENTNIHKDGHVVIIETSGVPVISKDGAVQGYRGVDRDITERKRGEEVLHTQQEELAKINEYLKKEKAKDEALLASIGEGMIATDNAGKIIALNHKAEVILGWDKEDLMGKSATEMILVADENNEIIPREKHAISVALATSTAITSSTMEYVHKKNGKKTPVAFTVSPVVLANKLIGTIAIFRDITKEKELEETRNNLLSLASHQLRTPLSGTKWLIETLIKGLHGPLTQGQKEYLDEIYKINERMTSLVHDMLKVLRIESSLIPTKKESVPLAALFDTVFDGLRGFAKDKQITLRLDMSENFIVNTDPLLLQNILEVLLSNAVNYSNPTSEVSVSIKKDPKEMVIAIRDSGIGIPKEEQLQIFKRFYRASNAKVFDTRGTGLGLYIASMLAKKIGVFLAFDSEVGKGSTFYVHIPHRQEKSCLVNLQG